MSEVRRTIVCAQCAMEDDETFPCDSPGCDGQPRFITAERVVKTEGPDYEAFARHAYEQLCEGSLEMDFGEIQDKLEECGIVERREVDPSTNEWDADFMYFWIEEEGDGKG